MAGVLLPHLYFGKQVYSGKQGCPTASHPKLAADQWRIKNGDTRIEAIAAADISAFAQHRQIFSAPVP